MELESGACLPTTHLTLKKQIVIDISLEINNFSRMIFLVGIYIYREVEKRESMLAENSHHLTLRNNLLLTFLWKYRFSL